MKKIGEFDGDQDPQFIELRTYYSTAAKSLYDGDLKKLYFRFEDFSSDPDNPTILFDSRTAGGYYFPHAFFTGVTVTDENTASLQVPFRVFLSAQEENSGFREVNYFDYRRTPREGGNGEYQPSICEKLTISFSENLKQVVGIRDDSTIYPSSDPSDPLTFRIVSPHLFWSNKSYYIVIQELPLSNYKNKRDETSDGTGRVRKGMVKNILANIPLPFEAVSSSLKQLTGGGYVGGVYDPPKKVIVDLKNQRIVTNRMSVQVFRMNSDSLATEIKQSVVNFTIMPPE